MTPTFIYTSPKTPKTNAPKTNVWVRLDGSGPLGVRQGQARREAILVFMLSYQREHTSAPTVAQIKEAVGLASKNTVYKHLMALVCAGRVENRPHGRNVVYWAKEKAND